MATESRNSVVRGVGLPSDVVEDILSAPRRRTMLECLSAAEGGLTMDDLVVCVRDREGDATAKRRRIRENLYDEHLPKLTATGVVTYDSMRERVELATPAIVDHID